MFPRGLYCNFCYILGDENATYTGILGAIVHDEYDTASSFWFPQEDRLKVLDFTIPYYFFTLGYITAAGSTGLDWDLYLRPFTNQLWAFSIGMVAVTLLAYFVTQHIANKGYKYDAMRIVTFCGWLSFVLVNAYYEGALTMFFMTTNGIEPKTVDVIRPVHYLISQICGSRI